MADAPVFEECTGDELAQRLRLPSVHVFERVTSTLDIAHELAASGTVAGTLVIAEEQTAGRGRDGRSWASSPGMGLWITLVERPSTPATLEVLSLRVGIHASRALDPHAVAGIQLKWPNDLYSGGRKLAGVLVEARWRDGLPEWVAIGFGVNVRGPAEVPSASLRPGTSRLEVLGDLVPVLRRAAALSGPLRPAELEEFAVRDLAVGRACRAPAVGHVRGITPAGELVVACEDRNATFRAGSLVLEEEP